MPFSTVVGHESAVGALRRALDQQRVPTGYLLVGPPHVGKTTLALAFAQAANCEQPLFPDDPQRRDACGECSSCLRIAQGRYPDVHVINPRRRLAEKKGPKGRRQPAEGEEQEDQPPEDQETAEAGEQATEVLGLQEPKKLAVELEQGLIDLEHIQNQVDKLYLARFEARRRVMVITSAEAMNDPAANHLLKILEEPPPDTTFVLTCAVPALLLPTIVSRCRELRLHPLPRAELVAALARARPDLSPERREAVAALAVGAYGRALTLLDNEPILALRGELLDVAAALPAAELWECLRLAEVLLDLAERWWLAEAPEKEGRQALKRNRDLILRSVLRGMLETLAGWFRDVVAVHGGRPLLNEDRRADLERAAQVYSPAAAVSACQVLEEIRGDLVQNVNPRLALEALLLRLLRLRQAGS